MNTKMEAWRLRPGEFFIFDDRLGYVVEPAIDKRYYIELEWGEPFLRNMGRVEYDMCDGSRAPIPMRKNDIVTKVEIPREFFHKSASTDDEEE